MKRLTCKGCAKIEGCRREGIDVDEPVNKYESLGCYVYEKKDVRKNTVGKLMEEETTLKAGVEFLSSPRGLYIVGQALYVAIEQLDKVKGVKRETSNINDMRFLMDTVFPLYKQIAGITKS